MAGPKKPNGAPSKPEPSTTRFQIASRLGALKDTVVLSDPFPTSAQFIIRRKGSRAHDDWTTKYIDNDPFSSAYLGELITGDISIPLTAEENELLDKAAKLTTEDEDVKASVSGLCKLIDRLRGASIEMNYDKRAKRAALSTGRAKVSDVTRASSRKQLEEALFLLAGWEEMPGQDDDGNEIQVPYTEQAARDLFTNDTPLEGCGLDELILSVPCWTHAMAVGEEAAQKDPMRIIIPGLTLGQAYILWVHDRAEQLALFRDQVLETAGKNSLPSSDSSILSGDGTNPAEPAAGHSPI